MSTPQNSHEKLSSSGESSRFKYGDPSLEDHHCCYYCGLAHHRVEAGGMWHCPNIACHGPGNSYFRGKLPSTRNEDNHQIVDDAEWMKEVENLLPDLESSLRPAVENSKIRIEMRLLGEAFGI